MLVRCPCCRRFLLQGDIDEPLQGKFRIVCPNCKGEIHVRVIEGEVEYERVIHKERGTKKARSAVVN